MEIRRNIEEKKEQILKLAEDRDGMIRYQRVVDILYDKDESMTDDIVDAVVEELEQREILVIRDKDEDYSEASAVTEDFIPADVNISQKPMNVYNLMERLENHEIDLAPEFQRNKDLWSVEKQSRLIESLMLKIPIPTFYFNAADDDKWIVIDGLQRLSAFNNFLIGVENENGERVKSEFTGMQYMTDLNGFTFDELPRQYVRRIKETPIVAYTVEKGTPDAIVYNIFQRINTGGVPLNAQEMRQALCVGKSTILLQRLAANEAFLEATQRSISTNRMADREYVNRFIAFTEMDLEEYRGNIDEFLRRVLKKVNQYEDSEIDRIEETFIRVMTYCSKIFGKYAFRKFNENWRRGPINKALFETWSFLFSRMEKAELDELVDKREKLLKQFQKQLQNMDYINALKSGDQYSVARRIELTRGVVREII